MSRSTLAIMLLAAACEKAGAPGPAPVVPQADAAATREAEPIDRCRGSDLDLAALAALGLCVTREGGEVSLERSWRVSVDPDPVEVRSGDSVEMRLVFTNTAPSARELTLDVRLLSDLSMARAHDERGRRQDMITRTDACEGGWGRAGYQPSTRVTVDPGGRAWIALRYEAATYERDESCNERRVGALAAGRYRLRVRIPGVPKRVDGALVVTR